MSTDAEPRVLALEGRSPARWANYRGDQRPMVGQLRNGFLVVEATFDPTTSTTRVGFEPAELADFEGALAALRRELGLLVPTPRKRKARR